jgi:hypothetical protein
MLAIPYADSRATDLSLTYGLTPLPALTVHQVVLSGARLELRVLGASHQVVLEIGGIGWSETLACLPDRPGGLPAHHVVDSGPLRSWFRASCLRPSTTRLIEQVQVLARRCEGDPGALLGVFPGSPLAITALLVKDRGTGAVSWRSWHAYPQTGELVTTASVVTVR